MNLSKESIGLKTLRDFAVGTVSIDSTVRCLSSWLDTQIREIYKSANSRQELKNIAEIYPRSSKDIERLFEMTNAFNRLPIMNVDQEKRLIEARIGTLLSSLEVPSNQVQSLEQLVTRLIIDSAIAANLAQLYETASDNEATNILQLAVNMAHKFDLFIVGNQLEFIKKDPDVASKIFDNLKSHFFVPGRTKDTLLGYTELIQWLFSYAALPLILEKFIDVNKLLDSKAVSANTQKYLKKLANFFADRIIQEAKLVDVPVNPFYFDILLQKLVEPQLDDKIKNSLIKLLLQINDPYMPLLLSKFISNDEIPDSDKRFLFLCLGALVKSKNEDIVNSALDELELYAKKNQTSQSQLYALKALSMSEKGCLSIFNGIGDKTYSLVSSIEALMSSNTDVALKNLFHIFEEKTNVKSRARIITEKLTTFLASQRDRLHRILTIEFRKPAYGNPDSQTAIKLINGLLNKLRI